MKKNTGLTKKLTALLLCVAMLAAYIPVLGAFSVAAGQVDGNRASDPSTLDSWMDFFRAEGNLSTENAGGVWSDKSVFLDGSVFGDAGIKLDNPNSFLVALSAIGSNMTITGMTGTPTDTILVLDVSGSMNSSKNNVAKQLVDSANTSIATLLDTNENNRVGVVLYSGNSQSYNNNNASAVLLPLDKYTTSSGRYLDYTSDYSENVSVNSAVLGSNGLFPGNANKDVTGATYIQKGVISAMNQFLAVENTTVGASVRKPVMVLMSDGAPTLGDTDFDDPRQYDLGDGSTPTSALGFVTQLSAAYAKAKIEAHYGNDCLFYTLGLGTGTDSVATSVLDPKNTSSDIDTFWTRWDNAKAGDEVLVRGNGYNSATRYVVKTADVIDRVYVDKYFDSDDYTGNSSSTDLQTALKNAFEAIVADIQLQSKYFPTLISSNEDVSGYVTIEDKIGKYMSVTDIKGLLINNTLFSGADLASNFVENGSLFGTAENPTALGDELIWSVKERLGIEDADVARTLVGLAYQYGQLSYTDKDNYSNYIGWYANAAGDFLGFYHEGVTVLPAPTGNADTDPAYILKSYGYLGAVDEAHGVSKSDMMYATVQVRESIASGEQAVIFKIPASLLPIVTYDVDLDENGKLIGLNATGAKHPMRLVYEVSLKEGINSFNVKDVVDATYLGKNTGADGKVYFYAGQYDTENTLGFNQDNPFSVFNPSKSNDRYYYQSDALIYTSEGDPYEGSTAPTGVKYRRQTVYVKNGDALSTEYLYFPLTAQALGTAKSVTEGSVTNWYVPAGNIRLDFDLYAMEKSENTTQTLKNANYAFVDTAGHAADDAGYNFKVGNTMGNNGRLYLVPESGLKLTKQLSAGTVNDGSDFAFVLTNVSNSADNSEYPAYKSDANGISSETAVKFTNGAAEITLKAGESIRVGGMTVGDVIKVSESESVDWKTVSVNNVAGNEYTFTVANQVLEDVTFTNAVKGKGNLTVSKVVEHDFGTEYQIPADKSFTMEVTLSGIGTRSATFEAKQTNSDITSITTNENGKFSVTLRHNEQLEVFGLPEGTTASVTETAHGAGFTPQYWDNGQLGDGIVNVVASNTVSVIVVNDYAPAKVYPVEIAVSGSKFIDGREWQETDSFTFELQHWVGSFENGSWELMMSQSASYGSREFNFSNAFDAIAYEAAGIYYYRVVEIEPEEGALGGVTYDKTVHSFAVHVGDINMDGQLEITDVISFRDTTEVIKEDNGYSVITHFTNKYATSGNASAAIDITKKVNNPSGSAHAILSGFTFGLYNKADGTPIAISQPTTERGFTRLVFELSAEGTYELVLREIKPDNTPSYWGYSTAEIPVIVTVTDDGAGALRASVSVNGGGAAAEFTNSYIPESAELEIDFVSKVLTGRTMSAGEFFFDIYDYSDINRENSLSVGTNNADGTVTFDQPLFFDKVGTYYYNIVERAGTLGGISYDATVYRVTVDVTDNGGKLVASYTLVNAEGNTVQFTNTYTAENTSTVISGNKVLTGRVLLNDEFTFVLTEALDASGKTAEGAISFESRNALDGSFNFPEITYSAAGTYYYTLSEKSAVSSSYGIKYDESVYIITVVVEDDGVGHLEVTDKSYTKSGANADSLTFTNEYKAAPVKWAIPGNKVLTGKVLGDGQFSFELYESDSERTEGKLLETVKNALDGTFKFSEIEYQAAGTYYYLVKEVNGGETVKGIIYDSNEYLVRVVVTDDLVGNLHTVTTVFDEFDIPQVGVVFTNIYEISGGADVTLDGEKTLVGGELSDFDFTFELYESDSSFETAEDSTPILTATPDENGKFSFVLSYTAEDAGKTYYYTVSEKNSGKTVDGMSYDGTVYKVTVVVSDSGEGTLVTSVSVKKGEESVELLAFENTYKAESAKVSFEGEKVLEGRELTDDEFSFELYRTGEDFKLPESFTESVKNLANGRFSFSETELTSAGKHYFVILENSDNKLGGVEYDSAVYYITVTVTDDLMGNLAIENTEILKDTSTADTIVFTNTYSTEDAKLTLSGNKTLTGRELASGEFKFILKDAENNETEALNGADGKFTFAELTFKTAGTYVYTIYEDDSAALARVTYDDSVYTVTVNVTDNLEGQLVAEYTLTKNGTSAEKIAFENKYTPKPDDLPLVINIIKTVENKGTNTVGPDGFEFLLASEGKESLSVTSDAQGKAKFELLFTEEDAGKSFTYVLTEKAGTLEDMQYSDAVYTYVVNITLDENNKLVATVTENGAAVDEAVAEFVNIYDSTPDIPVTGDSFALPVLSVIALMSIAGALVVLKSKKREQF